MSFVFFRLISYRTKSLQNERSAKELGKKTYGRVVW